MFTQLWSQVVVQQNGLIWHTLLQHSASEQVGSVWTSSQLPVPLVPHVWQCVLARLTHPESQLEVQQLGSSAQTWPQQLASEQDGVGCTAKQLAEDWPQLLQTVPACAAQVESHTVLQQRGSIAHTARQQSASEQFGPVCGWKQSRTLPLASVSPQPVTAVEQVGLRAKGVSLPTTGGPAS